MLKPDQSCKHLFGNAMEKLPWPALLNQKDLLWQRCIVLAPRGARDWRKRRLWPAFLHNEDLLRQRYVALHKLAVDQVCNHALDLHKSLRLISFVTLHSTCTPRGPRQLRCTQGPVATQCRWQHEAMRAAQGAADCVRISSSRR
jgi:hypothetical protein